MIEYVQNSKNHRYYREVIKYNTFPTIFPGPKP